MAISSAWPVRRGPYRKSNSWNRAWSTTNGPTGKWANMVGLQQNEDLMRCLSIEARMGGDVSGQLPTSAWAAFAIGLSAAFCAELHASPNEREPHAALFRQSRPPVHRVSPHRAHRRRREGRLQGNRAAAA